jgi:hypothetical protein
MNPDEVMGHLRVIHKDVTWLLNGVRELDAAGIACPPDVLQSLNKISIHTENASYALCRQPDMPRGVRPPAYHINAIRYEAKFLGWRRRYPPNLAQVRGVLDALEVQVESAWGGPAPDRDPDDRPDGSEFTPWPVP